MAEPTPSGRGQATASAEDIRRLAGPVADIAISSILGLHPTVAEVEAACYFVAGLGDIPARAGSPLEGKVAQICDILRRDETFEVDER